MPYAVIQNGVVTNLVEATAELAAQNGWIYVDNGAPGSLYDGAGFSPPPAAPVPVPQVVTIRQAKLALLQAGLLDDIDAAVAAAERSIQIEWEYATEVKRDWPTLLVLQSVLQLTDAQIDDLFRLADTL